MQFREAISLRRTGERLPLTSLIDVVFLLLIYFIVTSTVNAPESELASAISADEASSSMSPLAPQDVLVSRSSDGGGTFAIGARVISTKAELLAVLQALPKDAGVSIRVRDDAPVSAAAAAWQAARDAGFKKVIYAPAR